MVVRVSIVETGLSLMELYCHSLVAVSLSLGRGAQRAIIRRTGGATGPTGIYRCRIATNAVHSDTDESVGETVYVGLYPANGGKLKHRLAADINLPIVLV